MMLKKMLFLLVTTIVISGFAQERGNPIYSDSFDTVATFAEKWVPKDKRIKSENGKVIFPKTGTLIMRGNTPLEFYAEMDITVDMSHESDKSKWGQAFCGLMIDGYRFMVQPFGTTWMIYKLKGHKRSRGKHIKIDGYKEKKAIRLTLIRKVDNDVATYIYKVNGKAAGSFVCDAPKASSSAPGKPKTYKPLEIFSYKVQMTLDNFAMFALKRSNDDSPNVIFNSSFEHEKDGFPIYFCRNGLNLAKQSKIPYEDFLDTWTLDTTEKHSGKQSLKMVNKKDLGGGGLWAWGAGTVKDMPGVFSVWMKADREDLPIRISYGKNKEVKVGTSWKRYEFVNPKLPGAGVYSPVRIAFKNVPGTLWVDDLQAEFLGPLDAEKLKKGETFATPYKPSELDKQRFGKQEVPVRASEITIPKLPEGVIPNGDLYTWKNKATKLDKFYYKLKKARNKTETYLACDDKNLYVGYRCFVADLSKVKTKLDSHDSFSVFGKDSVEFFLDPSTDGKFYQFATDAGGTRLDIGRGRNIAWNGEWKTNVKLNEKTKSIDYEITIPLSTLASASMNSRWLVNFCRNDNTVKEHLAITKTPILGFQQTKFWPYAQLPADVVSQYSIGVTSGAYTDNASGTTISLAINNLTGKELHLNAELLDVQNKSGILDKKKITLKKGKNNITFLSKIKTNKVCLKLTNNGAPLLDQTVLLEKSAPVTMLGRLSYYMNEKDAVFKVNANLADVDKMSAILTIDGKKVKVPASPEFKISIPLKNIANGTYDAKLALMKGKKEVATAFAKLIKRQFKKGAAQINHFTRSLLHDGKPIFPFSPFFVAWKHFSDDYIIGAIDFFDRYGFKYIHILVDNRVPERSVLALKHAQKKGIKVLLWSKYYELTDKETDALMKKLDFPNVIAQMVMDEPELGTPSDVARAFLRKMRKKCPYHPVNMNNTVLGIPNRYADLETDILMLDDYLTNIEKRTVGSVVDATDIMWEAGKAEAKPCFYFLVGGNFPLHHREVSYDEQIAQTYGNIAAGCTGFSYFYGLPATPGNWKAYIQLNKEVLALNDIILTEEEIAQGTSSADSKILRNITKKHNGYVYMITCNTDKDPIDEITFTLPPTLKYTGEVEVMFENRKVPLKDGKFSDSFSGHSRHVYKVKIK